VIFFKTKGLFAKVFDVAAGDQSANFDTLAVGSGSLFSANASDAKVVLQSRKSELRRSRRTLIDWRAERSRPHPKNQKLLAASFENSTYSEISFSGRVTKFWKLAALDRLAT